MRVPPGIGTSSSTYDSAAVAALAALHGTAVGGLWTLRVADMARADVGQLDGWSLEAEIGDARPTVTLEATPGVAVPVGDGSGVSDELIVAPAGTVSEVRLEIDLTHAQVSDLTVTLKGPTGKRVTVHRRGSGGGDHLITSYGSAAGQPLAGFVGLDAQGTWTLSVTDRAGHDIGKLNHWRLTTTL